MFPSSSKHLGPMTPAALKAQIEAPYKVEIDLEKPIYNPGDMLHGKLRLIITRKLACDLLLVKIFGSARTFFTELSNAPGTLGQTKAYEQKQVLVDDEYPLWSDPKAAEKPKKKPTLDEIARFANPNAIRMSKNLNTDIDTCSEKDFVGLMPGTHEFTFQFKLPAEGLHTSFDVKNAAAYIRYYVIVQAQNDGQATLKRKFLFPVVDILDLKHDPRYSKQAKEPVIVECNIKNIIAKFELEKRGYVPGEPIKGTITIVNNSGKSLRYCSFHIVQRTIACSTKPIFHTNTSYFETSGMGLPMNKIKKNTKCSFPIQFHVPGLLPNLSIPDFIESQYCARLVVGNKKAYTRIPVLQIETPIIIGTHPTETFYDQNHKDAFEHSDQPPPYDSSLHHGPPSYAASVGGMSDIPGEKETEALLGSNGQQYSPLCYHYNFAFTSEDELKKT